MDEKFLLSFAELEDHHWWFKSRSQIVMDEIGRRVADPIGRVVEIGPGTGGNLVRLASMFPSAEVVGVEPSRAAREVAGAKGVTVVEGTFEAIPARDGSVDLLVALDVLEHCAAPELALADALRVLKPGGLLVLTVPALPSMWSAHDDINEHYRRYLAADLRESLTTAGLRIARLTYFNTVLLPGAWPIRRVSRLLRLKSSVGVGIPPRPVNSALYALFASERAYLARRDLRVGMSLLVSAHKPE